MLSLRDTHRHLRRALVRAATLRDERTRRGSAITELAVVLPLLLLTTIGLVDFGRAAYEAMEIENAAHAGASFGARSASAATDVAGIQQAALADIGDESDKSAVKVESARFCECSDGSSVSCDSTCGGVAPIVYVRVRVEKQFTTMLSYTGLKAAINLVRQVELRAS